jgi:hypothetical protein
MKRILVIGKRISIKDESKEKELKLLDGVNKADWRKAK